jgi:hypothetical protein
LYRKGIGRKKGISAVVGGAIVLALFFATVVPLVIFMQNSYALFLNESNSRRIFDTDRMSESLMVGISQDVLTKDLTLLLSNDGPVNVRIVRVWAIDAVRQTAIPAAGPCLEEDLPSLPPGANGTINVQACVSGFTGNVQFFVVTERGRIFSSSKVYLSGGRPVDIVFPYTLTVSIINMDKGRLYEVYVTPIGNGRVSPEKFTHKATASNENVTVAFGASPGEYVIALYESGKLVQVPEGNPQRIVVPESTAIIFTLGHKPYKTVPLEPIISAPSSVNKKRVDTIMADIYVRLPKNTDESVEITQIATNWIKVTGGATIDSCDTYIGVEIQPGQIELVGSCTITNIDKVTGKSFTITVNANSIFGEGVISSATYTNIEASKDIKVTG